MATWPRPACDRGARPNGTPWPPRRRRPPAGFVARVSAELESLVARLAQHHTGWFTRWRYEILLAAMLGMLLYRLGKNFFYDSWLAEHPLPVYGLEFYVSAGFWLVLWCLLLLWAFCSRLRRGLRGEINRLAAGWQDASAAAGIFARVENDCRGVEHFPRSSTRFGGTWKDYGDKWQAACSRPSPSCAVQLVCSSLFLPRTISSARNSR